MRTAYIEGVGFWAREAVGWPAASAWIRQGTPPAAGPSRPSPAGLPANERRRAPDSVLLALQVAEEAVATSGRRADTLASVFTSAHGDLPIVDALARQLASDPLLLSPTRFHHSVHNAASGYWAMASASHAPSTALSGFDHSFASGLLEALAQLAADTQPLLLVACDTEATGPLALVNRSRGLFGLALVLAPEPGTAARWRLDWRLADSSAPAAADATDADAARVAASPLSRALAGNAMADALPLLDALAAPTATPTTPATLAWPLGGTTQLHARLLPLPPADAARTDSAAAGAS